MHEYCLSKRVVSTCCGSEIGTGPAGSASGICNASGVRGRFIYQDAATKSEDARIRPSGGSRHEGRRHRHAWAIKACVQQTFMLTCEGRSTSPVCGMKTVKFTRGPAVRAKCERTNRLKPYYAVGCSALRVGTQTSNKVQVRDPNNGTYLICNCPLRS